MSELLFSDLMRAQTSIQTNGDPQPMREVSCFQALSFPAARLSLSHALSTSTNLQFQPQRKSLAQAESLRYQILILAPIPGVLSSAFNLAEHVCTHRHHCSFDSPLPCRDRHRIFRILEGDHCEPARHRVAFRE